MILIHGLQLPSIIVIGYFYSDDGDDDFIATVSSKPTAQEQLYTALCARIYNDELVRAFSTGKSIVVCTIVVQLHKYLFVDM